MSCSCGYQIYDEIGHGGVKVAGLAISSSTHMFVSGGVKCSGVAVISTNRAFDGYSQVLHLIEQGNGSANEYKNSAGGNGGKGGNGFVADIIPTQATGIYYECQMLDGNDYVTVAPDNLNNAQPITVELWAKTSGKFLDRVFYSRGATNSNTGQGWSIQIGHTVGYMPTASIQVIGTTNWKQYKITGNTPLTPNCWYHFAFVWIPATSMTLYVDAVQVATKVVTETTLAPSNLGNYLGRVDNKSYTIGELQEYRLSPIARPQSYIKAQFDNLCHPNSFYTVGDVETPP